MSNSFFYSLAFLLTIPSCNFLQKPADISIELKAEQVFEKNKSFKGLKVGGLSEIFFDKNSGYFFVLSDDKKNHRFYKMVLKTKPHYKLEIKDQVLLKNENGKKLDKNMDPEALVFYGKDSLFIAEEGQQIFKEHEPPQIFTFNQEAVLKEAWPLPPMFWKKGQKKQALFFGTQENKGFESLTIDFQSHVLWTATEQSLKQDLIFKNKSFVRLSAFDIKSKKLIGQYAYTLKNYKEGGLTALQFLRPKLFISLERAYKKQKSSGVNEVQMFLTNCKKASDIKSQIHIKKKFKACSKKLLWDSKWEPSIKVDNLEGVALGPILPSQKRLLILVSDNNFNEEKQKSQFLFFELNNFSALQNSL